MKKNSSTALKIAGLLADLARLIVLIGTIAAAITGSIAVAGLFALVFALLILPRIARIPSPFDLAVCILLPLATLATTAYWYQRFAWTDWVMHCLATGAIAAATYLMIAGTRLLPPISDDRRTTTVLLTAMIGLTLGVVWEFFEWFFLVVLNVRVGVGYGDTIADLAMDILGSLIAGTVLVAWTAQVATRRNREPALAPGIVKAGS
ncbi:hypothetical protein [Glycomyces algeriensis]|uniref:Uncharacterized protein n=1 Tax=Glycomyces algeriensis TaxID=256037 RepID=A0A9W6GAU5_9ACTN|nr:hypothetical protein [Glycomyces algeriensis]MDA1364598.1 hypothetical protein [Glycomyces algeriensis]MDR7350635.1 hypothetical protein [Glycomyces algeriensis]GLI43343.1 hypothetical protein GALLR39Z86_31930 [Glycomyces algeriensis]